MLIPGYPFINERVVHIWHEMDSRGDWITFAPRGLYIPVRSPAWYTKTGDVKELIDPDVLGFLNRFSMHNKLATHLDMETPIQDNMVLYKWPEIIPLGWEIASINTMLVLTRPALQDFDPNILINRIHQAVEQYHRYIAAVSKQPYKRRTR